MWLSSVLSALHLIGLAAGFAILLLRQQALRATMDEAGIRRVLRCDNVSGVIAIVWMGSGIWRAFGGVEKGTDFYLTSPLFHLKMGLLAIAWGFEFPSMLTFIRWRTAISKNQKPDTSGVARLIPHHTIEASLVLAMVFVAALMTRGVGRDTSASAGGEAQSGAGIWEARCVACHQADGRGANGALAADFIGDPTRLAKSDEALMQSIRSGVPGTSMPGWDGLLSEGELRAVLAYIRTAYGSPAP